jgi:hypothetical protein
MRIVLKRVFLLGLVAGVGYAIWRAVQARSAPASGGLEWETAPFPFPPAPRPAGVEQPATEPVEPAAPEPPTAAAVPARQPWIEPADGSCPATHPVKAKLSSGIFHVPGGQNYERTKADRCYVDAAAAQADGLRKSQR